ncbi:(2Fe-2S)-binding protein [Sphingobium sp.]|uniref:(2Fe-2S)-binding protein n=1 Tax=Sphingobium sp. TaxID=1912891 RepID=UPI00161E6824|nr:(2Fe-2S)-binding protein [Sphingobium sp.]HUD95555.1 (2Fe-2S)-binding protein [Sphingobium sp.]
MAFKLDINGKAAVVDVDPEMPLLWALRDGLGIRGPKFGCGIGACGACTVHLDGEAVRSCSMPVSSIEQGKVMTIEAMASDPIGRIVQDVWVELDVAQCGYCQPGQIMTATALLKRQPNPSDADIDEAMSGNLCRCATYRRIRAAILQAAAKISEKKA